MSKKKGEYSVLSEINTEEDWKNLCERQGLTVVDVYSDWSGPCSAMTNFLKKVKLEVNDELLSYAMAKTDKIPQLEMFKGHCKPIWLFIANGEPVAVVHGANAPLLGRVIQDEVDKERRVLAGEVPHRDTITFEEALPKRASEFLSESLICSDEEIRANLSSKDASAQENKADSKNNGHSANEGAKEEQANGNNGPSGSEGELGEDCPKHFSLLLVEHCIHGQTENPDMIKRALNDKGLIYYGEKDITLNSPSEAKLFFSKDTVEAEGGNESGLDQGPEQEESTSETENKEQLEQKEQSEPQDDLIKAVMEKTHNLILLRCENEAEIASDLVRQLLANESSPIQSENSEENNTGNEASEEAVAEIGLRTRLVASEEEQAIFSLHCPENEANRAQLLKKFFSEEMNRYAKELAARNGLLLMLEASQTDAESLVKLRADEPERIMSERSLDVDEALLERFCALDDENRALFEEQKTQLVGQTILFLVLRSDDNPDDVPLKTIAKLRSPPLIHELFFGDGASSGKEADDEATTPLADDDDDAAAD